MWLFILRCAILYILHTPVSLVQAYCWEPGKNPYFTGPPVVKQVDLQTVRVSWLGLIEMRECADQFLVKYWQKINPQDYQLTKLVEQQVNSIDIKIIPKVTINFKLLPARTKAVLLVLIGTNPRSQISEPRPIIRRSLTSLKTARISINWIPILKIKMM